MNILPNHKAENWHKDVFDIANLQAQMIQAHIAEQEKNPLYDALKNKNDVVADRLNNTDANLMNSTAKNNFNQSPADMLRQNGDVDSLLKYGLSVQGAYNKQHELKKDADNTSDIYLHSKIIDVFKDDLDRYKAPLTQGLSGKGVLTQYTNAIINDDASGKNFKSSLSVIKDKNTALLNISGDGNTIGTLVAAFGSVAQWEEYESKYSKLERKSKKFEYPCNDATSILGTPVQSLLIAKKLAKNSADSASRQLLFEHFVTDGALDINVQNQDGENIMHVLAKCSDHCALASILANYPSQTICNALVQKDKNGKFPIQTAIAQKDSGFCQVLLQNLKQKLSPTQFRDVLLQGNLVHTAILHKNPVVQNLIFALQKVLNLEITLQELRLQNQHNKDLRDPFELAVVLNDNDAIDIFVQQDVLPDKDKIKSSFDKEALNIKPEILKKLVQIRVIDKNTETEIKEKINKSFENVKAENFKKLQVKNHVYKQQNAVLALDYKDPDGDIVTSVKKGDFNYWLSQADVAGVMQNHYNLNAEDYNIIGSMNQLNKALSGNVENKGIVRDLQVSPNGKTFCMIVNIDPKDGNGSNHWVTVVLAKNKDGVKAYYADSLQDNDKKKNI